MSLSRPTHPPLPHLNDDCLVEIFTYLPKQLVKCLAKSHFFTVVPAPRLSRVAKIALRRMRAVEEFVYHQFTSLFGGHLPVPSISQLTSFPVYKELAKFARPYLSDLNSPPIVQVKTVIAQLSDFAQFPPPSVTPLSTYFLSKILHAIDENSDSWGGRVLAYAALFQINKRFRVKNFKPKWTPAVDSYRPYESLGFFDPQQLANIQSKISFPNFALTLDTAKNEIGLGYSLCHRLNLREYSFSQLVKIEVIDLTEDV